MDLTLGFIFRKQKTEQSLVIQVPTMDYIFLQFLTAITNLNLKLICKPININL